MSNQSSENPARNILQGYVLNAEFGGFRIPAPLQNLYLRDYAAKNGLIFKLSVGEYSFPGSTLQLEGIYPQLAMVEGIGMTSLFMLPKSKKKRQELYKACISNGAAIHFILESIVVRKIEDTARVEDVLRFHEVLKVCPKEFDSQLLPKISVLDSFT